MPKRTARESWGMIDVLPSGRLRARYVGPDHVRHSAPITFDSRTDARGWLANQRAAIQQGVWKSPAGREEERTTFGEFAFRWADERSLRQRTREEYRRLLRGPLEPFAGSRLSGITSAQVRSWFSTLERTGKTTQAARAYGLLRSILNTAVADGLLASNPCSIRGAQSKRTGKRVEPPTAAELEMLVGAMPSRLRAMVLIAAWGGLRFGELTELRRRDVVRMDDYYIVTISRAVTKTSTGYVVGKTKSEAGVRSVALPHHITAEIDAHMKPLRDDTEALLFPAADGVGHLAQSTLAKSFYPARAAAARPDMPFHALRHYGATKYAQTGATLREIQARLGHSTVAAAMRYQHAAGRDEELARRMSDLA